LLAASFRRPATKQVDPESHEKGNAGSVSWLALNASSLAMPFGSFPIDLVRLFKRSIVTEKPASINAPFNHAKRPWKLVLVLINRNAVCETTACGWRSHHN